MDRKILLVLLMMALVFIEDTWTLGLSSNNCPAASRISSCNPKCKENSNCHGAQICCTNICGTKTCTEINQYQSDNNRGLKGNSKGATGTYCGNVKCNAYEKCELDRVTKREKCVRA